METRELTVRELINKLGSLSSEQLDFQVIYHDDQTDWGVKGVIIEDRPHKIKHFNNKPCIRLI